MKWWIKIIRNYTGIAGLCTTVSFPWDRDSPIRKLRMVGPDTSSFVSEAIWISGVSLGRIMSNQFWCKSLAFIRFGPALMSHSQTIGGIREENYSDQNRYLVMFTVEWQSFADIRKGQDALIRLSGFFEVSWSWLLSVIFVSFFITFPSSILSRSFLFSILEVIRVLFVPLISALNFLSAFLLADLHTVAAVRRLLHPLAAFLGRSVIRVLTRC